MEKRTGVGNGDEKRIVPAWKENETAGGMMVNSTVPSAVFHFVFLL